MPELVVVVVLIPNMLLLFSGLRSLLLGPLLTEKRALWRQRGSGGVGVLISVNSQFCKLCLDVTVDGLICHSQGKASFSFRVRRAPVLGLRDEAFLHQ